jgi:tetratricopeptide (TPR) repeat protein
MCVCVCIQIAPQSIGCALHAKGQFKEALLALRRTVRIATIRKDDPSKRAANDLIIWVLKKQGYDENNLKEYTEGVEQSIVHEQTGDVHAEQSLHEDALEEYGAAIKLEEGSAGTSHLDLADLFIKRADVNTLLKDTEADPMADYKKAFDIYQDTFGEDNPYRVLLKEKMDPTHKSTPAFSVKKHISGGLSVGRGAMQRQISLQELLRADANAHVVDKAVKYFHPNHSDFCKTDKSGGDYYYETVGLYLWIGMSLGMNDESPVVLYRVQNQINSSTL